MSLRLKRLQSDYEQLQERFRRSRYIAIRKTAGNPPERYEIEYRVNGLVLQENGQITESGVHVAEIVLTRAYPRLAPQCKMLTPIFHPNIDYGAICIGDHWAAAESLADLVIRIGEMITYQQYNVKSPLNGEAARWAAENKHLLPVQAVDLAPPEPQEAILIAEEIPTPTPVVANECCQNCGASSTHVQLVRCKENHLACPDCLLHCEKCGSTICLLCNTGTCAICGASGCASCLQSCPTCGKRVCLEHFIFCLKCGSSICEKCSFTCSECGTVLCANDALTSGTSGLAICKDCSASCALCPPRTAHAHRELAQCQKCGAWVCSKHIHTTTAITGGIKVCDRCGVQCSKCGRWVTEAKRCFVCHAPVCIDCSQRCSICGRVICEDHASHCGICGKAVCQKCSTTCPACGKTVCRTSSHLVKCSTCGQYLCRDCVTTCHDCQKPICSADAVHCTTCRTDVCKDCATQCRFCEKYWHATHMETCEVCGDSVCPRCLRVCRKCGAKTCRSHHHSDKRLCVKCFKRQDRLVAAVALSALGLFASIILYFVFFG